jgi:tetratricopeptide (TPR) repeat protein
MEKKLQRNYQLLLQHVKEQPENAYAWFQLGQTLARMNIIKEAEEALQLSLQLKGLAPHIRASAAAVLAQLCGNTKRFSDALRWAELSLEAVPEQVYALHLQAYALYYLGRYAESEKVFTQVLEKRHLIGSQQSQAGFEVHIDENLIRQDLKQQKKHRGNNLCKSCPIVIFLLLCCFLFIKMFLKFYVQLTIAEISCNNISRKIYPPANSQDC